MVVLLHIANVLYVISYVVKEMFWLRFLTLVAGSVLIAYYVLLPVPLWAAAGWNVVFFAINLRRIQVLLLQRGPVRLFARRAAAPKDLAPNVTLREFAKLD